MTEKDTDQVAVRVNNLSKIYHLWGSPQDRLIYPLKRMMTSLLPSRWKNTNDQQKGYREFYALRDVSFEICKGESWGFIGVNGSGKSSLLKIISGNLRPSAGTVEVDGKVTILDYGSGFNGEFTGEENIYAKAALLGLSRKQIDKQFDSIVAFADIGDFIKQPVKTYSSGMGARLGFAIMAHVKADIIITDEALAVGDVFFVQKAMSFLRSFLNKGTFLFVSHSINDVLSLCKKAVWLDEGRVMAIGSAKDVTDAYLRSRSMAASQKLMVDNKAQTQEAHIEPEQISYSDELVIAQPRLSGFTKSKIPRVIRDPRLEFINRSPWRNDIEIPLFSMDTPGFGVGGAKIENVAFEDEEGSTLSWIIGAEIVRLRITVHSETDMVSPIVGFQVKDCLGQVLFADNTRFTTIDKPFSVKRDQKWFAQFCFQMPLLPPGEYMIRVQVARGEVGKTAVLHCIDNALPFRSVASGVRHALVGIPMLSIGIAVLE